MNVSVKLNIVNKFDYAQNDDYREIVIELPRQKEQLEKDFEYLGLNYDNSFKEGSIILKCEIIHREDQQFSAKITREISNIITKAKKLGYETTYKQIADMLSSISNINDENKKKLLAVLEAKRKQILNIGDAVKYCANLRCFEFYDNIYTEVEYGRKLIEDQYINQKEMMDHRSLERIRKDFYYLREKRKNKY